MKALDILILALAAWRLASLLACEDGPWMALEKLRQVIGVRTYEQDGGRYGTNPLAEMVMCVWCSSVWIGLALATFYFWQPAWTVWACLPLAVSAGAIVVEVWNRGKVE